MSCSGFSLALVEAFIHWESGPSPWVTHPSQTEQGGNTEGVDGKRRTADGLCCLRTSID